jgi:hypothetical protein
VSTPEWTAAVLIGPPHASGPALVVAANARGPIGHEYRAVRPGRQRVHLTVAIAYRAIQNGFDARFVTAAELIDDLSAAFRTGRLAEALAPYVQPSVLVVDEVGYLTYGTDAANMLFHVVNDRHIEQTFLEGIEGTVLHQDFIDRVVEAAFASRSDHERNALIEERSRLVREIQRLTAAITNGADIPALVAALSERDKQLKAVSAKLARPVVEPLDREVLRAALKLREGQWKQVLRGPHIAQARLVLQHLIDLPIHVMNVPRPSYLKAGTQGTERIPRWEARTRPGALLTGLVCEFRRHG